MITVAIVAILAAVAVPAYRDYIVRSRLADATNALSSLRARMEQYYQDNRTYKNVSGKIQSPCATSSTLGTFAIDCLSLEDTRYRLRATGSGMTTGFVFTMDHNGNQATTKLPSDWGSVPDGGYTCWIMKKGGTC